MLNSFIFFCKKNSSFSFVFYYLERSCMLCNKFSLKIHYLMSLKYFQMINCSLFVLMRSARSHRFNSAFDNFNFKFASCNIIC